jgi:tetratricopeptide (TPR) repeat protein
MHALQILEKLEYADSLQMNILEKKAICFQKLGQIQKAKNSYNLLLTLKPDSQDFLNEALSISIKQGNIKEIIEFQKKLLLLDSINAFYLKEFGKTMFKINKFDEGIFTYKKALKYNPDDLESLTDLANVYLNRGKDLQAIPLISKAYILDSNMVKVRQLKARLAYRANDFKEFIKEIEFTMTKGDTTAHYQRLLGNSYFQIGDLKKSKEVYEQLLASGENSEVVRAGLGYVAARGDSTQLFHAFLNFDQAIDLGTSDRIPEYKIEIYNSQEKMGNVDFAIQGFKEILDKYQLPIASFRLAEIYENKKNDKTLATIYFQEYIRKCNALSKPDYGCRFKDIAFERSKNLIINNPNITKELIPESDSTEVLADSTGKK